MDATSTRETRLITTLGPKSADELGPILPHEHVFVDLRTWDAPGYGEADPAAVVALMAPEIERIKALGITALIECSTVGVGRRADFDLAVSSATDFPIVVPTGIHREPWVPPFGHEASQQALTDWMLRELEEGIDDTGVQAAWRDARRNRKTHLPGPSAGSRHDFSARVGRRRDERGAASSSNDVRSRRADRWSGRL